MFPVYASSLGRILLIVLTLLGVGSSAQAQTNAGILSHDDRLKADLLVVVAHPDDETMIGPFLAQASLDRGTRIAVVYMTRGGRGGNGHAGERAAALGLTREWEARQALSQFAIRSVWFLDGTDTPSQNVLDSLATWGHGAQLERLVRLVRMLRPEAMLTMLPAVLIGQNHADHQAAGVIATEAFDLAGDPTAFPSQLSSSNKVFEGGLDNLVAWKPKRLYYFDDTDDADRLVDQGPCFSPLAVSASQSMPYWLIALRSKAQYRTQFPALAGKLEAMDAEARRIFGASWPEKRYLFLGKARVPTRLNADIFDQIDGAEVAPSTQTAQDVGEFVSGQGRPRLTLGGPWAFYELFWARHGLRPMPGREHPEIGLRAGRPVSIPLIYQSDGRSGPISLSAALPPGWRLAAPLEPLFDPGDPQMSVWVDLEPPALTPEHVRAGLADDLTFMVRTSEGPTNEVSLRVRLQSSALPF